MLLIRSCFLLAVVMAWSACTANLQAIRESDPVLTTTVPGSYQALSRCLVEHYEAIDGTAFVRLIDGPDVKRATVTAAVLPVFVWPLFWPHPSFLYEASMAQNTDTTTTIQLRIGHVMWGRSGLPQQALDACTRQKPSHATP